MKGILHLIPPQPRYTKTWDVNKVLSYLKSLGPNDSLMLKQLILKTAALLTILGGRRIHTFHMLSVIDMDQSPDKLNFHIIELTKCSKPTRSKQSIVYRAYAEDQLLCPVKCMYAYLAQRSKIITQNLTEFFINFGKTYHAASKDSMAERSNGKFWYRYRNLQVS